MMMSTPSSARRSATARPRRFADPVTRATLLLSDSLLCWDAGVPVTRATLLLSDSLLCWDAGVMAENDNIPTPGRLRRFEVARQVIHFPGDQTDRIGGGWRQNESRSAGDCR